MHIFRKFCYRKENFNKTILVEVEKKYANKCLKKKSNKLMTPKKKNGAHLFHTSRIIY